MLPARPTIPCVRRRNLPEYLQRLISDSSSSSSDEDMPAQLTVRAEVYDRQSPEPEQIVEEEEPPIIDVPEPFWPAGDLAAGEAVNPVWHAEGVDEEWQDAGESESTVNLCRLRCPVCYTSVNRYALDCGHVLSVYTNDPQCPVCRTPILLPPRRFLL